MANVCGFLSAIRSGRVASATSPLSVVESSLTVHPHSRIEPLSARIVPLLDSTRDIMATTPPPGVPPSLQADLPDTPPGASPSSGSQKPTVLDAVKTINPVQDLQRLPSMPCASIGGLRFIFSRGGRGTLNGGNNRLGEFGAAANWAVGAWGIASLGAW